MLKLSPLCGRWCPLGVFKFRTWEEKDRWDAEVLQAMTGPVRGCAATVQGEGRGA
jgi:hypothetical protein